MTKTINKAIAILTKPIIRMMLSGSTRTRVILVHQDEILLVRNRLGSQKWSLPGGGVKKGEESKKAAARELLEELNIEIRVSELKKLTHGQHKMGASNLRYNYIAYVYIATNKKIKIDKKELIDAKWFDVNSVPLTDCSPLALHILSKYLSSDG